MDITTLISLAVLALIIIALAKTARIVPQRSAFIVERLGKYAKTLEAGFHILVPFVDRVSYKHTLKEEAIDVPSQACVTKDNIQVVVNGVLYLQVVDAKLASYGINDYRYAAMQLAQTTLRSVVGKIELDKTFEERETINTQVVLALDEAAKPWGVKVLRYEIADIELPATILDALEKQMRAERERRAVVAQSEGEREAKINVSEGVKQETINLSEADKQRQINEAEGRAREIELIAEATAEGLRRVAEAINTEGGKDAVALRVAEQYVREFGKLAKTNNTMILPAELSNIGAAVAAITKTMETVK
ncbi:SPFH domain-containing protein [Halopseudomonas sp.]|jgi:regulator of protease activity HflC (stomatin/prohibitin superfamily)|uniref:SPFH domain-containing protein n=1 Tax=Halopseudomonas sp. TaxID=2901191 RepID=UPI001A597A19|nr:paraslipin [Pseudomonas sp.]|tara:strand:+ start:9931 stop:10848 length:918 start_codon:yes stop_codon:yes gene_type:complete